MTDTEHSQCIKITLEMEDRIIEIDYPHSEQWMNDVNSMCTFMDNRGLNPFATNDLYKHFKITYKKYLAKSN